jgi:hypothetical protein
MNRTVQELSYLLDSIPPRFAELEYRVRKALELAEIDPEAALVRTRKTLEWITARLFERHIGKIRLDDPPPLEQMIRQLFTGGHLPKVMASYANAVRELGNVGAHDQSRRVDARDLSMAVRNLMPVIEWYVTEGAGDGPETSGGRSGAVAGGATPRMLRGMPWLLPHLCDRSKQEEQIAEAVAAHRREGQGRPLVFLVHGDEHQCHDHFLERLRHDTLPRLLGLARDGAVYVCQVVCAFDDRNPSRFRDPEWFRDHLWTLVSRDVFKSGSGKPEGLAGAMPERLPVEEIIGAIARRLPVIASMHLTTDEWRTLGRAPFEGFLRFWSGWPQLGAGHPLIGCLAVTYRTGDGLAWPWWLLHRLSASNRGLRRFVAGLEAADLSGVRVRVLEELLGVTQLDAENWARDQWTRDCCGGKLLVDDVRRLYRRPGARVSMQRLAARFEALLHDVGTAWEM